MEKFNEVKDKKFKISLYDIILIIFYALSSLNILLSIYNGYVPKNEDIECSCEVRMSMQ